MVGATLRIFNGGWSIMVCGVVCVYGGVVWSGVVCGVGGMVHVALSCGGADVIIMYKSTYTYEQKHIHIQKGTYTHNSHPVHTIPITKTHNSHSIPTQGHMMSSWMVPMLLSMVKTLPRVALASNKYNSCYKK